MKTRLPSDGVLYPLGQFARNLMSDPSVSEAFRSAFARDAICRDAFIGVPTEIVKNMAAGESPNVAELINEVGKLQNFVDHVMNNVKMELKTIMSKIDETDIERGVEELRINLHALIAYPTHGNYTDVCACIHKMEFLASEIAKEMKW